MSDFFKDTNTYTVDELIRMGFLKPSFKRNIAIYKAYLCYCEQGEPSTDAIVHTADDFGISDRQVFRIINKFNIINK